VDGTTDFVGKKKLVSSMRPGKYGGKLKPNKEDRDCGG
jgi:hypothetical protein